MTTARLGPVAAAGAPAWCRLGAEAAARGRHAVLAARGAARGGRRPRQLGLRPAHPLPGRKDRNKTPPPPQK